MSSNSKRPSLEQLQAACDRFNGKSRVGGRVRVQLDSGEVRETITTSEAQVLSGHTPVVWLEGVRGCYALDSITILDDGNTPLTMDQRANEANKVIRAIGKHGRRFLCSVSQRRYSVFYTDAYGQVWYVDHYTGLKVYPFGPDQWPGFTPGDTMKAMVAVLAQYIKEGTPVPRSYFDNPYIWGYDDTAMAKVREEAFQSQAIKEITQ
jgi:hypothetical protein